MIKDITQSPYRDIIKQQEAQLLRGRLLVRYSGTEPLLRIMVEDETQEHAEEIAHNLALNLSSSLQRNRHDCKIFKSLFDTISSLFINGLLTLLPITITAGIFSFSFNLLKTWLAPLQN